MTTASSSTAIASRTVQPVPDWMNTLTPFVMCRDAAAAIEFYKEAFGGTEMSRLPSPEGWLLHAVVRIGDSLIMLADACPDRDLPPAEQLPHFAHMTVHLQVENVDEVFERAVKLGAKVSMPVSDMFWGDRYGRLIDPFGHHWAIATHIADLSPEELEQAAARACAASSPEA
ncbi:MAG: VOC family protein [Verrucomicrobiota bacterium JB022]|nr:VOC family protein [Verrucomicrobiota bacterium JB022]